MPLEQRSAFNRPNQCCVIRGHFKYALGYLLELLMCKKLRTASLLFKPKTRYNPRMTWP